MPRGPGETPGLDWKKRGDRRIPRWRARRSAVQLGYRPAHVVLAADPDDLDTIAALCRAEQERLEAWLRGLSAPPMFDGTLGSLIRLYQTDPASPYQDLKYSTQRTYDDDLKILWETVGSRRLKTLNGSDFRRWYNRYKEPARRGGSERIRRAHGVMTMLRILFGYGRSIGLPHCGELKDMLAEMRFKTPPARSAVITYQQAVAFIAKAHDLGFPEMALGQALQFEGTMRQIDIIGEWIPDPGGSTRLRWANGLIWQDLRDFVLVKATTKTGQIAAIDFKEYPLALAELNRVPPERRIGPVIVDSKTRNTFRPLAYTRRWRQIADAAGIPREVLNRDSRAGGVTEGSDAGADLEHLRHHASHSSVTTTARYSRKTLDKTRSVARLRLAHRERKS
jgi:hypothetical protein